MFEEESAMPELSRFYGIVIRLHYEEKEHNPPHIHARYGKEAASIDIETGEIISGSLPSNARKWITHGTVIRYDPKQQQLSD